VRVAARLGGAGERVFRWPSYSLRTSLTSGTLPGWKTVLSSMTSGALASIVGTPFDVALVRMQSDSLKPAAGSWSNLHFLAPCVLAPTVRLSSDRRGYKNVFDALARVTREEGITRLWRGFEPTVCRAIAMNVGQLATYDLAKASLSAAYGDTTAVQLGSSAVAGLTCVVTSLPFDLIKTRLQNMKVSTCQACFGGVAGWFGWAPCLSMSIPNPIPIPVLDLTTGPPGRLVSLQGRA
jgi:hypothetical protein